MGDRYDISIATLFKDGEYRPIAVCDAISFGGDVARSGYVGIEAGIVWDYVQPLIDYYEGLFVSRKRRKTTYKTIRRDCAKRNRGK